MTNHLGDGRRIGKSNQPVNRFVGKIPALNDWNFGTFEQCDAALAMVCADQKNPIWSPPKEAANDFFLALQPVIGIA